VPGCHFAGCGDGRFDGPELESRRVDAGREQTQDDLDRLFPEAEAKGEMVAVGPNETGRRRWAHEVRQARSPSCDRRTGGGPAPGLQRWARRRTPPAAGRKLGGMQQGSMQWSEAGRAIRGSIVRIVARARSRQFITRGRRHPRGEVGAGKAAEAAPVSAVDSDGRREHCVNTGSLADSRNARRGGDDTERGFPPTEHLRLKACGFHAQGEAPA